jgi:glutathione S-transferase
MIRLYTFTMSTFSEKVRWVLDYEAIAYREQVLTPGLHMVTTRRLAAKSSVPVLVSGREAVQGSGPILEWLQRRYGMGQLLPSSATPEPTANDRSSAKHEAHTTPLSRIQTWEALADKAFGEGLQRILYSALLESPAGCEQVCDLWSLGGPTWSRAYCGMAFPVLRRWLEKAYVRRGAHLEHIRRRLLEGMDATDRVLAEQPYLMGDTPTRADVTLAALLAPMVRPANHLVPWPAWPPVMAEFFEPLLLRPTARCVARMYERHRGPHAQSPASRQRSPSERRTR